MYQPLIGGFVDVVSDWVVSSLIVVVVDSVSLVVWEYVVIGVGSVVLSVSSVNSLVEDGITEDVDGTVVNCVDDSVDETVDEKVNGSVFWLSVTEELASVLVDGFSDFVVCASVLISEDVSKVVVDSVDNFVEVVDISVVTIVDSILLFEVELVVGLVGMKDGSVSTVDDFFIGITVVVEGAEI